MSDTPIPPPPGSPVSIATDQTTTWRKRRFLRIPIWAWGLIGALIVIGAFSSNQEKTESDGNNADQSSITVENPKTTIAQSVPGVDSETSTSSVKVNTTSSVSPTTEVAKQPTPNIPNTTKAPSTVAPVPTTAKPRETVSQANARKSAESYLRVLAFSQSGLIEQLLYEGFSQADAEYAVSVVVVNWSDQAFKSAKSYLRSSSFSRSGLIDQLLFEGFSQDQAVYGVDQANPDWNEQAFKTAQSYLRYSSFSRSGLIDQLLYEGFTQEQAEYGVNMVGL